MNYWNKDTQEEITLRHEIIRHHPGLLAEKERDARERSEDYSMSMHTSESSLYHTTGKQLIAKVYLSCWRGVLVPIMVLVGTYALSTP